MVWEGARSRDGLVVISGDLVSPRGCEDAEFASCPVAAVRESWVSDVIAAWRAADRGHLTAHEPAPSRALMQAIDAVGSAVSELDKYRMQRARERRE